MAPDAAKRHKGFNTLLSEVLRNQQGSVGTSFVKNLRAIVDKQTVKEALLNLLTWRNLPRDYVEWLVLHLHSYASTSPLLKYYLYYITP